MCVFEFFALSNFLFALWLAILKVCACTLYTNEVVFGNGLLTGLLVQIVILNNFLAINMPCICDAICVYVCKILELCNQNKCVCNYVSSGCSMK